ncbi:hypothetical protein AMTRI_Chr13g86360 [Amborella trichopoda]
MRDYCKSRILSGGLVLCLSYLCICHTEFSGCNHICHGCCSKVFEKTLMFLLHIDFIGLPSLYAEKLRMGQAGAGSYYEERWGGKSGGNNCLCGWGIHHHPLQGSTITTPSFPYFLGEDRELEIGLPLPFWELLGLAPVLKKYPARISVTSFTCFFGVIQFLIIAAFVEADAQHWIIQSKEELFTILYAGFVASGIAFSVQIWCIDRGGPMFVAVYQPVQTIAVAIMASMSLGDQLYTGGIVGAILIVVGLYSVLRGKSKENNLKGEGKGDKLRQRLVSNDKSQAEGAVIAVSSDMP